MWRGFFWGGGVEAHITKTQFQTEERGERLPITSQEYINCELVWSSTQLKPKLLWNLKISFKLPFPMNIHTLRCCMAHETNHIQNNSIFQLRRNS